MNQSANVSPSRRTGSIVAAANRRDFLKVAAAGGVAAALPSLLTSCKLGDTTSTSLPTAALVFDFSNGDTAYLQFLYAYKQLQADFYVQSFAQLAASDLTAAEKALVTDIRNHEVIHRETLKAAIGSANDLTVQINWHGINFKSRVSVIDTAIDFEDVASGMYANIVQRFTNAANASLALNILSVEARHSASLRDNVLPKSGASGGFAIASQDTPWSLTGVAIAMQQYVDQQIEFTNAPAGV